MTRNFYSKLVSKQHLVYVAHMGDVISLLAPTPDESENIFLNLVDSISYYAIFLMDPDGKILSWNRGAEKLKGYSADEIIGRNFSTFYTDEDLKRNHPTNELQLALKHSKYEATANDEFDANLILLDLMMPVMDGFEFCRQKLFHPKFKNVPLVVMSADGNVKTKKDLTQAQAYIKKPLDIFVLLDTVRKYAQ